MQRIVRKVVGEPRTAIFGGCDESFYTEEFRSLIADKFLSCFGVDIDTEEMKDVAPQMIRTFVLDNSAAAIAARDRIVQIRSLCGNLILRLILLSGFLWSQYLHRIEKEANNYRKYVRYNVPLSARLSSSGKAFESDGNTKHANTYPFCDILRSKSAFGALVSDLIAGSKSKDEKKPVTFLDKVMKLILESKTEKVEEKENFVSAIEYQFKVNTVRWKRPSSLKSAAIACII